jgi:hypothetical protein
MPAFNYYSRRKNYALAACIALFLALILFTIFTVTQAANPHASELSFIENSNAGIGSVVPASCESGLSHELVELSGTGDRWRPIRDHLADTSGTGVVTDFYGPASCAATLSFTADSYNVSYGGVTTLRWAALSSPGINLYPDCAATLGWSGTKPNTGSEPTSVLYGDTPFKVKCKFQRDDRSGNGSVNFYQDTTIIVKVCPAAQPLWTGSACVVGVVPPPPPPPPPPNAPPTANAGPDIPLTLPTTITSPFGATASDSDGTIVSIVWTIGAPPPVGSSVTITNGGTLTPIFSGLNKNGPYTFTLTVTDDKGATAASSMNVVVDPYFGPTLAAANAPDCKIPVNQSTCITTVSWLITNPSVPSVTQNDVPFSSLAMSPGVSRTLQFGGAPANTMKFFDGSTLLGTLIPTASCNTGSSWDPVSGKCKATSGPSLNSASASNCIILVNQSTCDSTVKWDIKNPALPSIMKAGTPFSAAPSSGGTPQPITFGADPSNTMTVTDSGIILSTLTPSGSCASGSSWVAGKCTAAGPAVSGNIAANPAIVTSGGTSVISWSSSGASSCIVNSTGNSDSWAGLSDPGKTSSPIAANTTYRLFCDTVLVDQVTINVGAAPVLSLIASPRIVEQGGTATVSYDTGSQVCTLTGAPGTVTGNSSISPVLNATTKFTLTCPSGSKSVTIEVVPRGFET